MFLTGKSFTSFAGTEAAYALLFPMETLFESYIAAKIRKILPACDFQASAQDRKHHLFDAPSKRFLMKPDIVVSRRADGAVFVMDTKWKMLSDTKPNYGISQADMYQMYAYQKKYSAKSVTLLYPMTDEVTIRASIDYSSGDGAAVRVRFVDLFDAENCLKNIVLATMSE